jgi:hypothetical protein
MEAEDWNKLTESLVNTAWTTQDLEEKHGVRSIELFLRLMTRDQFDSFNSFAIMNKFN